MGTPQRIRSAPKLSEEELEDIKACKTPADWATVQEKIKRARGGRYPSDWYERVLAPGEARRVIRSVAAEAAHEKNTGKRTQASRIADALEWLQPPSEHGVAQIRTVLIEAERSAPDGLRDESMDDSLWRTAQRVCHAAEQWQLALSHMEEQLERKRQEG